MEHPDIKVLEGKVGTCDSNILTFEEAIEKEQKTIREYREYMTDPNCSFPQESLENGIDGCKKNIKTFEEAIDNERETKKNLRFKIDKIRELESIPKVIEIEAEIDNGTDD